MSPPDGLAPPRAAVVAAVRAALEEDLLPLGDLTSGLVPESATARAVLRSRARGVVAGTDCVLEVCRQIDERLQVTLELTDGCAVGPGDVIGEIAGPFRSILSAERSALNFLSHLSGVATLTAAFVAAAHAVRPGVRVLDTRKTTPGLRSLEKAAVRAGGGTNHRANLSEGVLVKDNHLGALSITAAVRIARERWPGRMVEVECDRLDQVIEAVGAGASIVMCDNMTPVELAAALEEVRSSGRDCLVEMSGGVTLETIGTYAAVGPDLISVGAITNSAPVLDIGLDLDLEG